MTHRLGLSATARRLLQQATLAERQVIQLCCVANITAKEADERITAATNGGVLSWFDAADRCVEEAKWGREIGS